MGGRTSPGIRAVATRLLTSPLLSGGQGSAVFDFSGTGPEVFGNLNAPRAITLSALIYCLRCLVGRDIPLNQVCKGVLCTRTAGQPQAPCRPEGAWG